jgi:hypothetical protein
MEALSIGIKILIPQTAFKKKEKKLIPIKTEKGRRSIFSSFSYYHHSPSTLLYDSSPLAYISHAI